MHRRTFLTSALALTLMPQIGRAAGFVDYQPGLINDALAEGRTLLVDYSATWCGTCRRQERVLNDLRDQNAAYDAAMTFVRVDWDTYKKHAVTTSRGIPRRSTLILLRGEEELGRIVAGTSQEQIKALLDIAL